MSRYFCCSNPGRKIFPVTRRAPRIFFNPAPWRRQPSTKNAATDESATLYSIPNASGQFIHLYSYSRFDLSTRKPACDCSEGKTETIEFSRKNCHNNFAKKIQVFVNNFTQQRYLLHSFFYRVNSKSVGLFLARKMLVIVVFIMHVI